MKQLKDLKNDRKIIENNLKINDQKKQNLKNNIEANMSFIKVSQTSNNKYNLN